MSWAILAFSTFWFISSMRQDVEFDLVMNLVIGVKVREHSKVWRGFLSSLYFWRNCLLDSY